MDTSFRSMRKILFLLLISLSLHAQNASANRGACVQNCRRSYTVKDNESGEELLIDNEYIMSPQDLCTINILDQFVKAGVEHRFLNFSEDFCTWVFFYGPDGGEEEPPVF